MDSVSRILYIYIYIAKNSKEREVNNTCMYTSCYPPRLYIHFSYIQRLLLLLLNIIPLLYLFVLFFVFFLLLIVLVEYE